MEQDKDMEGSGELRTGDEHPESRRTVAFREEGRNPRQDLTREGRLGGSLVECADEDIFLRRGNRSSGDHTPDGWPRPSRGAQAEHDDRQSGAGSSRRRSGRGRTR